MIPGRVVVTELPSGIVMRNTDGQRIYPIDLLHKAFHHAVVMCALAGEDAARSGIDPGLLADLEQHAKDGEEMIAEYKACLFKAALGVPVEEW
jgi:hypothetical protein